MPTEPSQTARSARRAVLTALVAMCFGSLALRYPGDHEIGVDSFFIHALAQSIANSGRAAWTLNPLSYFGWYPASYPSGGPFLLASESSLSGLQMEPVILIATLLMGPIGILAAFVMARELRRDAFFSLTVALVYGFAPRFLSFTLWLASTRNLFMTVLPLMVWAVLRFSKQPNRSNATMLVLTAVLLAAAHRLVVLVLAIFAAFILAQILHRIVSILRRNRPRVVERAYLRGTVRLGSLAAVAAIACIMLFGLGVLGQYSTGEFAQGSTASAELVNLSVSLARSVGIGLPLMLVGLVSIVRERDISVRETFVVVAMLALIPTLLLRQYTGFYILPFLAILSGYGLRPLSKLYKTHKGASQVLVVTTVVVLGASSAYILGYERSQTLPPPGTTYDVSNYLAQLGTRGTILSNDGLTASRISATTGWPIVPTAGSGPGVISPEMLVFGFYNSTQVTSNVSRLELQNLTVDSDSLWVVSSLDPSLDYVLLLRSTSGHVPSNLQARYSPMYYLEIKSAVGQFYGDNGVTYPSPMSVSLHATSYALYDDGAETLWSVANGG